jgi:threonine dehydrogenase-like Zn-dependent dehydrogenase
MVHYPGIELIGVHTHARAMLESRPHAWTGPDDSRALLKLVKSGKINMRMLVSEIHSPHEAPQVYERLGKDPKNFPIGVIFDWNKL